MARATKRASTQGDIPPTQETVGATTPLDPDSPPAWVGEGKKPKTIVVKLKDDGSADLEGMRDATVEKLRIAMGQAPIQQMTPKISADEVGMLYDGIGGFEAWIASRFMNVPPELAHAVFTFNDAEKAALAEPTANVLNKYTGSMLKWKDEIFLLMVLYKIHQDKFLVLAQQMQLRQDQYEAARQRAEQRPGAATGEGAAA